MSKVSLAAKFLESVKKVKSIKENYVVTDENDPQSDEYCSGSKSECDQWIKDNESNDQYKGCEFSTIKG